MEEFQTFLNIVKTIGDLGKNLLIPSEDTDRETTIRSLTAEIISAQSAALSAMESQRLKLKEIAELEERLKTLEEWSSEKKKYRLMRIQRGMFVYAFSPSSTPDNETPPHWLCTRCFDEGHKSILRCRASFGGWDTWYCPRCDGHLEFETHRVQQHHV